MPKKINDIINYFDEILPNASCELNYHEDFELLIAVILSAQTTDKSVNEVTPILFKKYPTPKDLSNASLNDVENIIKSIGLYHNKAKNIIETCKVLDEKYQGRVPRDFKALCSLKGVGVKTANVVMAELFKVPCIAVDTHVSRCSKRLGLAKNDDDPIKIEQRLEKMIPIERQILFHHQMIHFGRYYCLAKNPKCEECKLCNYCSYYKKQSNIKIKN